MTRNIGGQLTLEALARLHRPSNAQTLRAAAVEMRQRGMGFADIARALGIAELAARELLQ